MQRQPPRYPHLPYATLFRSDGKVKLGRTSADGRENLLAILGPGQMFGELSLFDPGPRSATVTAVTDTSFFSLSHDDLLKWLEDRKSTRLNSSHANIPYAVFC